MDKRVVTLCFFLLPMTALAKMESYRVPVIPDATSWVVFHVPYTLGTHDGEAKLFSGNVTLDTENITKTQGEFSVPIQSLTTKKEERDCHMMESLGLDYRESDFPEEHVCTESYNLAASGKNAVKFPTITLKIFSLKSDDNKLTLTDQPIKVGVDGEWTVHGKSYRWVFPLTLSQEGAGIRIKGEVPFSLRNHDIIVKPAKFLFFDISVLDNIKTEFNLYLEKTPAS